MSRLFCGIKAFFLQQETARLPDPGSCMTLYSIGAEKAREKGIPDAKTRILAKGLNNTVIFGILYIQVIMRENNMSRNNKKTSSIILVICIVFLILGLVAVIVASKIEKDASLWGLSEQTWETAGLACLNAGWIGALVVYWVDLRHRRR